MEDGRELPNKIVISTGVLMGLRPTQGDENALCPATALHGSFGLPFVIPTEAKRSGGICSSADLSWKCFSTERSGEICDFLWFSRRL
jgi:hypothetical protein